MHLLSLTLQTPAENLALDEALLMGAESGESSGNVLRFWESSVPFVVLGRGSRLDEEVHVEHCRSQGIAVHRRCSGGASIVCGPGCLMYAVVLAMEDHPEVRDITSAHVFVLDKMAAALQPFVTGVTVQRAGTSDLVVATASSHAETGYDTTWQKISGNSMRKARRHVLYHGTFLYAFDPQWLEDCLRIPPRMPAYRTARRHIDFVGNLPITRDAIESAVTTIWHSEHSLSDWPRTRCRRLAESRYVALESER